MVKTLLTNFMLVSLFSLCSWTVIALCCWKVGVFSPFLPAILQPRRHGELLASIASGVIAKMSRAKKFSFQQMRFMLGWGSKLKLDDGLEARLKGYR